MPKERLTFEELYDMYDKNVPGGLCRNPKHRPRCRADMSKLAIGKKRVTEHTPRVIKQRV